MNNNKICFITCVNDMEMYNECVKYLSYLNVPDGYEVDNIYIEDAVSMTQGYNEAMKASDAKYKVYLHQDVFIINKNFIYDIINIFNKNEDVGLIGVAGAKVLPTNGVWWESANKRGKVYDSHTGKMELLDLGDVKEDYDSVQGIDGLIMITQYDVPWREDIFDGWHFYDLSQSTEFIRTGYEVAVPKQDDVWCIHDCGLVNVRNGYENYRRIFLEEYSGEIFPLVSILIPTYNQTKYLKEAIESAINQTYLNTEIIVGDDSTNEDVHKFLLPYLNKYKNIIYFKNERKEMDYGASNGENLFKRSNGEYANYLFHDDIFHATKIEKMMNYYLNNKDITIVTSHRQLIDEDGNYMPDNGATQRIFEKDTLVNGKQLSLICLENLTNFIGEPTTVLFKKSLLTDGFGRFNHNFYLNIGDVATWFSLLRQGDAVYISESLSYFRQHNSQNSHKSEVYTTGIIEWKKIIDDGYNAGIINNRNEYKRLISQWFSLLNSILINNINSSLSVDLRDGLKKAFKDSIDIILDDVLYNHICVICGNKIEKFLPYEINTPKDLEIYDIIGSDTNNFSCPHCYCHDRERHLKMFFDELGLWKHISDKKVLHIAPEVYFQQLIERYNPREYVRGDLYPSNCNITKIDITDIVYKDEYFDFIICNHVLEHVEDDKKAMHELYRVLKKNGYAVLQTPYSNALKQTYEDKTIQSSEKRLEKFGQEDHVRIYGLDFFERLEEAGFDLKIFKNDDLFSIEECKKYGVNFNENLILVYKN